MTKSKNAVSNGGKLPLEARVIQSINSFPAPKTTQDNLDRAAAEFATANLLRMHADKRYEAAKRAITVEYGSTIDSIRTDASELMQKTTITLAGADWQLELAANKPSLRVDVDELKTELVRLGVKASLIDTAMNAVSKKSTPALIISASPALAS